MSLRDRGWLPMDTVRSVGPLAGVTATGLRETLIRLHRDHPTYHPVCRVDTESFQWVPIPGPEFAARTQDMVVEIEAGGREPAEAAAWRVAEEPMGDRPVFFALCDGFVGMKFTHALGDGKISNAFMPEVLSAAAAGRPVVPPFPHPVRLPLLRASVRHFGRHPAQFAQALRVRRPPVVEAPADELMVAWKPQLAHYAGRSTTQVVKDFRTWRKANLPDVGMAAIVFAAIASALDRAGIGTDRAGLVTLIDARRYLKPDQAVNGNFAVGQYITPASMTDPAAVDAALKAEIASGRGLAMMALRDAHFLLAPSHAATPRHTQVRSRPRPELTLTHIGRLDSLRDLPWAAAEEDRRTISIPSVGGPEALTVSIAEMFGALHLNTTFHSSTFDPAAVAMAIDLVRTDPVSLVS
jgi:hypothetical protein